MRAPLERAAAGERVYLGGMRHGMRHGKSLRSLPRLLSRLLSRVTCTETERT